MFFEKFERVSGIEINGRTYVNTTPHPVDLQTANGYVVTVPPSGVLINAKPHEVVVGERDGVKLVKTVFRGTPEGEEAIQDLEFRFPGCFIIGSIIAAQAYPGKVLALCPAPGFERVPPAEKRMLADKFTVF